MSGRRSAPKRSRKAGEAESASKAAKLESSSGGEEEDEENVVDDDDDEVQSRSKGKRIVQVRAMDVRTLWRPSHVRVAG